MIVTTGSIDQKAISPMEAAVVTLDWNTLAIKQFWQVPASERQFDADFGSSRQHSFPAPMAKPTLAPLTKMPSTTSLTKPT